MKPFKVLACLGLFALVVQIVADTTQRPPIRGTNTIPIQKNFPAEVPPTEQLLLMSISMKAPPPLPLVTNHARLKLIRDGIYEFENLDPDDVIVSPNRPTVTQTKGGWRITFK